MAYFNPTRPGYIEDPYPALAALRRQEPVHRSPDLGAWVVTSYEHCERLVRDDETFSSDPAHATGGLGESVRAVRDQVPLGTAPILGNTDAPDHTRLRAIVNRAFTPRAIADMRPRVEASVQELLDAAGDGPLEVMSALAEPMVVTTVLEHLGVPQDDRPQVREWAGAVIRARADGPGAPGVSAAAASARDALLAYLRDFTPTGRSTVIDTLRAAADGGETLSAEEMAMLLIHISLAGNGPTAYALGNIVLGLANHPEALSTLAADPEGVPTAIEELIRFDSPTHMITRFALADTKLGPRNIRAGDTLYTVIAAANRDPAQFPNPDVLDITRNDNRHLSFGLGIHFCLGAPLARLELDVALRALLQRYGAFRMVSQQRGGTFLLRGPRSIVIESGG